MLLSITQGKPIFHFRHRIVIVQTQDDAVDVIFPLRLHDAIRHLHLFYRCREILRIIFQPDHTALKEDSACLLNHRPAVCHQDNLIIEYLTIQSIFLYLQGIELILLGDFHPVIFSVQGDITLPFLHMRSFGISLFEIQRQGRNTIGKTMAHLVGTIFPAILLLQAIDDGNIVLGRTAVHQFKTLVAERFRGIGITPQVYDHRLIVVIDNKVTDVVVIMAFGITAAFCSHKPVLVARHHNLRVFQIGIFRLWLHSSCSLILRQHGEEHQSMSEPPA